MACDVGSVAVTWRAICSPSGMPVTKRAPGECRGGGCPALSGASPPKRVGAAPNTGESSAGDQTVARGVGGIVAIDFANVFDATIVAHELRQAIDELRAIFGDQPGIGFQQLIHQLPAADAIVVGGRGPRQAARGEHFAELLGDGCLRSAMRESVRREKHVADALASAAFGDALR